MLFLKLNLCFIKYHDIPFNENIKYVIHHFSGEFDSHKEPYISDLVPIADQVCFIAHYN